MEKGREGTRGSQDKASGSKELRPDMEDNKVHVFHGEWDEEGVYFYQAYCEEIASWALEHQTLGGPSFKPVRMTWIKPSLAWVLYRSGYGRKPGQTSVLKIKLHHAVVAELLGGCTHKKGGGGGWGRVQWDPARDLMTSERKGRQGALPRRCLRQRAIQIGLKGRLSEIYVENIISVEDVTHLARQIEEAHGRKTESEVRQAMEELRSLLPVEREYLPACGEAKLRELGLIV